MPVSGKNSAVAARPTYWAPALSESQYAVYHFDVKTMSLRDSEGNYLSTGNDAPLIFASRTDAELYCRGKIAATPTLGCRILDSHGTAIASFADHSLYSEHHGLPAAKRTLRAGILCLIAGIGCICLDAWSGFRLILGVLLAVRFLMAGTVKTLDGIAGLRAARPTAS